MFNPDGVGDDGYPFPWVAPTAIYIKAFQAFKRLPLFFLKLFPVIHHANLFPKQIIMQRNNISPKGLNLNSRWWNQWIIIKHPSILKGLNISFRINLLSIWLSTYFFSISMGLKSSKMTLIPHSQFDTPFYY